MKKASFYLVILIIVSTGAEAERLSVWASIEGISGVFQAKPTRQSGQNETGTVSDALVAFTPGIGGGEDGSVFHYLTESRRLDGQRVIGLGEDYPYRVARNTSASGVISATVYSASEEYSLDTNPSMIFTLDLVYGGMPGKGLYWASVKDGKTYQAYTLCLGTAVPLCNSYHEEFLTTVRYCLPKIYSRVPGKESVCADVEGVHLYRESVEEYWNDWKGHKLIGTDQDSRNDLVELVIRGEGKTVAFDGILSVDCATGRHNWRAVENFFEQVKTHREIDEIVPDQVITKADAVFCGGSIGRKSS